MQHRVTMIETTLAADYDGLRPKHYLKGRTYNISDYLLSSFIAQGVVKISNQSDEYEMPESPEYEDKMVRGKRGRPRKNEKN